MSLDYGDIILTGTPEGVGPVSAGQVRHAVQLQCSVPLFALLIHFAPPLLAPQVIEAGLADLTTMSFPVAPWATAKL